MGANIDYNICKKCGGACCKKSGCDYLPRDFEDLGFKAIIEILEEGNTSIVSMPKVDVLSDGRKVVIPFLFMRARAVNHGPIDLISIKTRCSMLTENGCFYDESKRPSGGLNLVPVTECDEYGIPKCYPAEDLAKLVFGGWESYQKTLAKVVKKYTGKSVEQQFWEDFEKMVLDYFNGNFQDVHLLEIEDVYETIKIFQPLCPKEYSKKLKEYFQPKCALERRKILAKFDNKK